MRSETVTDPRIKYRPGPGVLQSFDEKMKEYGSIPGDPEVIRKSWENIEVYANRFVWMVLTDI